MDHRIRLRFQKGDLWAAAVVLLLAAALGAGLLSRAAPEGRITAQIYLDGTLTAELPLDRDGSYTVEGSYRNTVTVRDGRVSVTASDCPGGDCIHSGAVSAPGRSIVCLPNRMEVRLTGASDVDIVTG